MFSVQGYFPSIPEDTRREYAENIENVKTINELRTVFGLITKQSDVIRAIQAANLAAGSDQVTPLLVAEGLVSSGEADRSNQSQQNTSGNNNQNIQSINAAQSKMKILNTSIEVAVLVKHIKVSIFTIYYVYNAPLLFYVFMIHNSLLYL